MLEILEQDHLGQGRDGQLLDKLERLARLCQQTALCGLGRAAPNPILSSAETLP